MLSQLLGTTPTTGTYFKPAAGSFKKDFPNKGHKKSLPLQPLFRRKMKTNELKGHLAMLGANMMWGLMAPVSKFVLQYGPVNAVALTTFRMVGAMVLFWAASLFMKKEPVPGRDLVKLFFAALLSIVLNQGSYIFGVSLTSPIDASIVTTTSPILVMLIAALYLKEPITGKKVTGIFVGAAGALLLILSSRQIAAGANASNVWGDLLCLLAQLSFSIYFVLFKGLIGRYSPVTLMKWMFTYASLCTLPFAFRDVSAINFAALPPDLYVGIAQVVAGGTFIAYLLMPVGQHNLRPTVASMYNYVQPIVASAVAVAWGMDSFGWMKTIAVALVFSGVYIVTQSKSRAQLEATRAATRQKGRP